MYSVLLSKAGRDRGRFFAALKVEGEYALIADGDLRKIERPKRKNLKHLGVTAKKVSPEALKSNRALRAELRGLTGADNAPRP